MLRLGQLGLQSFNASIGMLKTRFSGSLRIVAMLIALAAAPASRLLAIASDLLTAALSTREGISVLYVRFRVVF